MQHTAITMNSNQLTSWNEIPVEKKITRQLVKKISTTVKETQVITVFKQPASRLYPELFQFL